MAPEEGASALSMGNYGKSDDALEILFERDFFEILRDKFQAKPKMYFEFSPSSQDKMAKISPNF